MATKKLKKQEILNDYRIINESRQASILARKEVLTGKAKFGLFGDGKELAQIAMAKQFQNGDWRSGYYRDQTFMLAIGELTLLEFFNSLYGNTEPGACPTTGGRMMNNHFATISIDKNGEWKDLTKQKNSSADISPTAGQMPRLLGLAYASKLFRNNKELEPFTKFSISGNEVAFGTIGDASTSEGHFFETINAAGVLQVPMAMSVWDDGYGISVPKKYQTTKSDISALMKGFEEDENNKGYKLFRAKAWDYPQLVETYEKAIPYCRKNHIPVFIHVDEVTQPLGHSTSGSHERYKDEKRMQFEKEFDCIVKMKDWILNEKIASPQELEEIENQAITTVKEAKDEAWKSYITPIENLREEMIALTNSASCNCAKTGRIVSETDALRRIAQPTRKDVVATASHILRHMCQTCNPNKPLKDALRTWIAEQMEDGHKRYSSHLYSESEKSPLKVKPIDAIYSDKSVIVPGREILNKNFDIIFERNPLVVAFGEDVGGIGGVNQTFEGLQKKYGELRVTDTGIREATILGQGLGLALRGFRPIVEIQYFDYLLYALQTMSDDLATTRYRTIGGQIAPLIITTRGHRLEGIWHSGSALSMVINSIKGVHVLTPRNMTQAAGFYNTALEGDDPVLIIEPLNGYRLREKMPDNIGDFRLPFGQPEVIKQGSDITIVTYGACVRIAEDAVKQLKEFNISAELIDVQSLIPFDINHTIVESLKKTNKILFFDEDVPGGATSFMMQKVLEDQRGFYYLDSEPKTLTAKDHRPAYTTDGDYFSNPNAEDVFDAVYDIMHEYNPNKYPQIF
jgi:2-oxoisovalerate dehydrogenase E1 component